MPVDAPAERDQLFESQRSFAQIGASTHDFLAAVRPPTEAEARDRGPRPTGERSPREARRAAVEHAIRDAFSQVSPEGRVALRDAFRADADRDPELDWFDRDTSWTEIPSDVLEYFGSRTSVFNFGNPASFRYYLPAYMLHTLRTRATKPTIYALDLKLPAGADPLALPEVAILDHAQRAAVAQFLRFQLDYEGPDEVAARALARIWGAAGAAARD